MGNFINKILGRVREADAVIAAKEEKDKHKRHLELMIAELVDIRSYWAEHPTYSTGTYCPVSNKLHQSIDYLSKTLHEMKKN